LIRKPAVALAQHVMPLRAGRVGTHSGPALTTADSMRITVHGRGAHGSMPQTSVDAVVLAAMVVVRLQTIVSREVAPSETAVLTVGSILGGTKSNVIPDQATLQLNIRTFSD
jgi:metal-dependent amidase/aminoacylase/carboxypeptidase family protein